MIVAKMREGRCLNEKVMLLFFSRNQLYRFMRSMFTFAICFRINLQKPVCCVSFIYKVSIVPDFFAIIKALNHLYLVLFCGGREKNWSSASYYVVGMFWKKCILWLKCVSLTIAPEYSFVIFSCVLNVLYNCVLCVCMYFPFLHSFSHFSLWWSLSLCLLLSANYLRLWPWVFALLLMRVDVQK